MPKSPLPTIAKNYRCRNEWIDARVNQYEFHRTVCGGGTKPLPTVSGLGLSNFFTALMDAIIGAIDALLRIARPATGQEDFIQLASQNPS